MINKIFARSLVILMISILGACATIDNYLITPPAYDASDQCNIQVQEIGKFGKIENPIDSLLKTFDNSMENMNFEDFFKRASTLYIKEVMSNGGIRALLSDINSDVNNHRQLNYAVRNLKQCRTNQSRQIAKKIKRSSSKREAIQEKEVLRKRVKRDNRYITVVNKKFGDRISIYEETSGEMNGSNTTSEVRFINISSLNVRDRPTTSGSSVLGSLPRDTMVGVIDDLGGWIKIEYRGRIAYISKKYTRITSATTQTAGVDKAIVSAKNTHNETDQMLVEIDEILASDGIT